MRFARAAPIVALLVLSGCVVTKESTVKTGLFNDNFQELSAAYEKVDQMERGKATRQEIEALGFNFSADNVERVPGPFAFRRIFGENVFQNALSDYSKADVLLAELNQYKAFFIPYKDITTRTDRFYFSKKEIIRKGDDLLILIMFKKDVLFYADFQYVKIDSKESEGAFAQGLLDIIEKYGKFGSNLRDVIDNIREWLKDRDD
jgi:outer membrane murein-binding lipoprotein Lpp